MALGRMSIGMHEALTLTLSDSDYNEETSKIIESRVICTLNEAIGNIVSKTMPAREIRPILPVQRRRI